MKIINLKHQIRPSLKVLMNLRIRTAAFWRHLRMSEREFPGINCFIIYNSNSLLHFFLSISDLCTVLLGCFKGKFNFSLSFAGEIFVDILLVLVDF